MNHRGIFLAAALFACTGAAANHERLGDAAYGRSDYTEAFAEYRAAARRDSTTRLLGKLGAAALHTGEYRDAAVAYRRLAAKDVSRRREAATGLSLAAQGAERDDDAVALLDATLALRAIAPEQVAGRSVVSLVRGGQLKPKEMLDLFPFALATAADAGLVDSIMVAYGMALGETASCEDAMRAFRVVLRRSREPQVQQAAAAGLTRCGLQLGRDAMEANDPSTAIRWFDEAASADTDSAAGRLARVYLGDARLAQGDPVGAAIAYQAVVQSEDPDSISQLASRRLSELAQPTGPDSSRPRSQ